MTLITGTVLALVLIAEGLAYALAPLLVERLLEALRAAPLSQRRVLGLLSMATGMALIWLIRDAL